MRLTNLCDAIMISRPRVDQWIATGAFRAPERSPGSNREWSERDAVRVLAMATLIDAGMDVESAGIVTQFDLPAEGFLVAWTGFAPIGGTAMKDPPKMQVPGFWRKVVAPGDLAAFLSSPDVNVAFVVDAGNLNRRVRGALVKESA